jgi:hypothetical protein
MEGDSMVV